MCGIAGWYRRAGRPVDAAVVRAQCTALRHRGPDDQGQHVQGDIGLGMRRLAVVDLAGGHQPMQAAAGRYTLVCNGEVVNFPALRSQLQGLGHVFHTRSDTEVVLQAYVRWGAAAWARLEGMFAIALWDAQERSLHLVRDPLGIKPLYWTLQDGALAFGSELKALGPVPGLRFQPCAQALEQYLALGAVLAPRSIYRQVHKLEPGCVLRLGPVGEPQIERYWQLRVQARQDLSERDWIEECRQRLLDTVGAHLVADVPLGAFISGGVDSSAVVAAMSRLSGAPVRTFSIGFADPRLDESAAAAQVAAHLGCQHTARRLEPAAAAAMLARMAPHFDEPFADDSAIPTWWVSQLAREQVTVALSGDGGDELFAGYRRHRAEAALHQWRRLPGQGLALAAVEGLLRLPLPFARQQRAYAVKLLAAARLARPEQRFLAKQVKLDQAQRASLMTPALAAQLSSADACARWADELFPQALSGHPLDRLMQADTSVWLPDDMLVKVDRASMAHSLEVRVPLLSHRFVEWAAGVPRGLKLRQGVGKWLLRKAIEPWLPAGLPWRPKQGFSTPLAAWMRGELGQQLESTWHASGIADSGLFQRAAPAVLLQAHRSGQADHAKALYTLLMLAHWWPQRLRDNPPAG